MSFCITHQGTEKFLLGDFSAAYLESWERQSGPAMKQFLNEGVADADLIKRMVSELSSKEKLGQDERQLLRKLKKAKAPVAIYG